MVLSLQCQLNNKNMKTPYLDEDIKLMESLLFKEGISEENLKEYKAIKKALLSREEILNEAADKILSELGAELGRITKEELIKIML